MKKTNEHTTLMNVYKEDLVKFKAHCRKLNKGRGEQMIRVFSEYVNKIKLPKEGE